MTDEFEGRSRLDVDHVAEIVAAYVSNNHIALGDMPTLIASVHASLAGLVNGQPAVVDRSRATDDEIRKSIKPDALISFIDGKPYKSLKRHLGAHGLDPVSYRYRYGLPVDYPMVAPTYSARRSEISRDILLSKSARG